MFADEIPYRAYLERPYPAIQTVGIFGPWQILSSTDGDHYRLLLVNTRTQEDVIVCEYETWSERQQDILHLRRLRPGDDLGGVVPASRRPDPPPSPAANAVPVPSAGLTRPTVEQ